MNVGLSVEHLEFRSERKEQISKCRDMEVEGFLIAWNISHGSLNGSFVINLLLHPKNSFTQLRIVTKVFPSENLISFFWIHGNKYQTIDFQLSGRRSNTGIQTAIFNGEKYQNDRKLISGYIGHLYEEFQLNRFISFRVIQRQKGQTDTKSVFITVGIRILFLRKNLLLSLQVPGLGFEVT